jgi:c-di-GMP-binding flagellar brake protein YcgR
MEARDRRNDDRKQLQFDVAVELRPAEAGEGQPPLIGLAEDLGMTGIGVLLEHPIAPALQHDVWFVRFALPDKSGRPNTLTLECTVAHEHTLEGCYLYGFRFLGINRPAHADERRVLRQFLLSDLRALWEGPPSIKTP